MMARATKQKEEILEVYLEDNATGLGEQMLLGKNRKKLLKGAFCTKRGLTAPQ